MSKREANFNDEWDPRSKQLERGIILEIHNRSNHDRKVSFPNEIFEEAGRFPFSKGAKISKRVKSNAEGSGEVVVYCDTDPTGEMKLSITVSDNADRGD